MRILKTRQSEKLEDYELKKVKELKADWFVYYYKTGDYDGSGFCVWRKDTKFFYTDMGHCSCYGPTDDLISIPYNSIDDIEKIAGNSDYNGAKAVIQLIKTTNLCVK